MLLAACGQQESSEPDATPTPEATPQASSDAPAPSDEPAETDSGSNSGTALADLLPDSLGGLDRTDVNMTDSPLFAQAIGQSGIDASEVEFIISTYGTGADAIGVTSMRIPDIEQPQLEQLARLMAGMPDAQGGAETATIGGKEVLALSAANGPTGYMYFADGAVFIIAGPEAQAAELLSQLP